MSDTEDDDLRAVHEEIGNVVEWLRYWSQEGFIFHSDGSVVLTRGVRNDLTALADELAWVATLLPIRGSGDDP
jgi:hypothetical protein